MSDNYWSTRNETDFIDGMALSGNAPAKLKGYLEGMKLRSEWGDIDPRSVWIHAWAWLQRLSAILVVLALATPAGAVECAKSQGVTLEPFASEAITISTAALPLTVATYTPASGGIALEAFITVAAANIRAWFDGTAPTDTTGHILASGGSITICQGALQNARFIRDDAVDAVISVTYLRAPGNQ